MSIMPNSRPKMKREELISMFPLKARDLPLLVVGIRGYYKDTMGKPGVNDRGLYDDAMFVLSDTVYRSFNANTDPSAYRKGHGFGDSKGMASLKPGLYFAHNIGLHKGAYKALVQRSGEVTVVRDGNPNYEDTGEFGINIHRGGLNGTSSLGCQTIHPSQYNEFINLVEDEAEHRKIKVIPYLLLA